MKSEQSLLVSEGMVEYWKRPGVRERRALQSKIREREAQLERLERHGMTHTERYAYIADKLAQVRAQLEQLK